MRAERLIAEGGRLLYRFEVEARANRELLQRPRRPWCYAMKRALVTGGSGAHRRGDLPRARGGRLRRDRARQQQRRDARATLAAAIRAGGGSARGGRLRRARRARHCARELEKLLQAGPIQVLVNNAGIHDDAPMAGMSAEQWHGVIDVSLNGFFNVTQPLLLPMMRTRWGRIVAHLLGRRRSSATAARRTTPRPRPACTAR